MGDWIKNNKFEALLLLVVIMVAVVAVLFGRGKGELYEQERDNYQGYVQAVTGLKGKKPYPTSENAKNFELQIDKYEEVVDGLRDKLLSYRPDTLGEIAPAKFIENLNAARAEVTRMFDARRIEYPGDKFYLGFENYTGELPKGEATAQLDYQLGAMKSLFGIVADGRPSALLNVHRAELPVEKDKVEETSKNKGGKSKSSRGKEVSPYERLPVEVTFRSTEPVMRKIISDLVSHEDYYFVVRSLRIQNEKLGKAPSREDVKFEAPVDAADPGEPFDDEFGDALPPDDAVDPVAPADPDDPAQPAAPVDPVAPVDPGPAVGGGEGRRILGQVLGAEQIDVLLEVDIILFKAKETADGKGEGKHSRRGPSGSETRP